MRTWRQLLCALHDALLDGRGQHVSDGSNGIDAHFSGCRHAKTMDAALTVLVIDDEPDHRAMVRAVLADEAPDVRVLEASDGRMGLLRRRGIDAPLLILCDQNMPVLNGHHVFMCLGGRRRPDERWVVVSSDVAAGPLSALQAAGVDEVVQKPVAWMEMASTVRRLLADWRSGLSAT